MHILSKRLTIEIIIDRMKDINPNVYVYEQNYVSNRLKLRCKCLLCESDFYMDYGNLSAGKGCKSCNNKAGYEKRKFKLEELNTLLSEWGSNIIIIEEHYKNTTTKIKCKCKTCGYEFYGLWSNLKAGHGCTRCANVINSENMRLSNADIKGRLSKINKNIEIIGGNYYNSKTKLKAKCNVCGRNLS